MNETLKLKLDTIPSTTGIYKFFDSEQKLLYVGKALNLRSRVNSYFRSEIYDRPRIRQMLPLVNDVEVVETNNEIEALILESAIVRKEKPPFNSDLKDDKSYAWIYISTRDEFPTVKIVRSVKKGEYKSGRMFGPYPNGYAVKRVFSYLRKIYPFCTCKNKDCSSSLNFHIGLCPGPYAGAITKEDYRKNINSIIRFLNGKQSNHIKRLEKEMNIYSKKQEFEKAALLRDRVKDLRYLGESINFTYYDDTENYKSKRDIARSKSFESISLELGIKKLNRIECYDISNIQGKHAYGSMVVAQDGEIKRSDYRIFKIKGIDTPDDPAMLKEVLTRRMKSISKGVDDSLSVKPDLLLIDGGRSQLGVIKKYIPDDIYILGISKGKRLLRAGSIKRDEFWFVRDKEVYEVEIESPEILIDLRNEAHRFAITHYRKRSIKASKMSILDTIDGIGEKRKKNLLKKFGSIENIKKASIFELSEVLKNEKLAQVVKDKLP
jgi:excinuclease ABC subunit C